MSGLDFQLAGVKEVKRQGRSLKRHEEEIEDAKKEKNEVKGESEMLTQRRPACSTGGDRHLFSRAKYDIQFAKLSSVLDPNRARLFRTITLRLCADTY